jgi:hypothetical protein
MRRSGRSRRHKEKMQRRIEANRKIAEEKLAGLLFPGKRCNTRED